ncbi:hypothetical protein FB45DRAFT_292708 [Roridomyces roridus]|uniref:Uncharacterized protein n=1 Tax=Roridomyces roridus TaxID=1738132 RepID=A0AAD7CBX8_9AGAR|nr:hypothetical protein FB45DRAFT_292708 [Roridomyces roridus]
MRMKPRFGRQCGITGSLSLTNTGMSQGFFPFSKLPTELALPILAYASGLSQGTYRSLLLTNKAIHELTCIEMLPLVAVVLTTVRQMTSFKLYLRRPNIIPHIHSLWAIAPGSESFYHATTLCTNIIRKCTAVRSLACQETVLHAALTPNHTHCVDLTLIGCRQDWRQNLPKFFDQIQHLHLIDSNRDWLPRFKNLTRLTIALASDKEILSRESCQDLVKSPKLLQVVITTRRHGKEYEALSEAAQAIDDRFGVMHLRRRWKEVDIWRQGLRDPDRFWDQAKEEKYLPPPPRVVKERIFRTS